MCEKWNNRSGLLAFLLVLCIAFGSLNSVVFAAEQEETQSTGTEAENSGPEQTTEETIPEKHILLQWDVDSSLTYRVDEDDYTWKIYDADGNVLTNGSGKPASAGYELTGHGEWFGSAVVKLTITNNLTEEAQLRLLFRNDLSAAALAISSTLESEDGTVTYNSSTGELFIGPDSVGVVTMTITADVLQNVNATIDEDNNIAGWIQVQVVSPVNAPEEESQQNSGNGTENQTEEPAEEPSEKPTEEPAEEPTEAVTEAPSEEPTEEPTEEHTTENTGDPADTDSEDHTVA